VDGSLRDSVFEEALIGMDVVELYAFGLSVSNAKV
jgi:hypothetical protein